MSTAIALGQTLCHGPPDSLNACRLSISTQNPDELGITIALTEKAPIAARVLRGENGLVGSRRGPTGVDDPAPPGGQKANPQTKRIGAAHHIINMLKVGLARARRVAINQR